METQPTSQRYYLRGVMTADREKLRAILMIALSLFLLAIVDALAVRAISAMWLLAWAWLFLRPPREDPGFYVELGDKHVIINSLWKRRIPYAFISKAEFRRYNSGELGRAFANTFIFFGRLGGSNFDPVGPKGEMDRETVQLTFDRLRWSFSPVPPFLMPKREWFLPVIDSESLVNAINKRLGADSGLRTA